MAALELRKLMGKRTRGLRLSIMVGVFFLGYLFTLFMSVQSFWSFSTDSELLDYTQSDHNFIHRHLLVDTNVTTQASRGEYPPDIFTLEEKRKGAVCLHVFAMVYMFVALAIVCDEFFVPCLGVIIEKLAISEDVAGATFMAAGGSMPELFTSLLGLFVAKNNVGIGTIVGSAVFNILFVIGMCAMFSKEVLHLTWWPLFRDVSFYSIDLILLIIFFLDQKIVWWEALILFCSYIAYVLFMKFNETIEQTVKNCLKRISTNRVASTDALLQKKGSRRCSLPILHSGSSRFRHGVLQLMIHTIDPLGPGSHTDIEQSLRNIHSSHAASSPSEKVQDKAVALHAVASLQLMINMDSKDGSQPNGDAMVDQDNNMQVNVISNGKVSPGDTTTSPRKSSPSASQDTAETMVDNYPEQNGTVTRRDVNVAMEPKADAEDSDSNPGLEEEEEPLDISWPDTWRKRITYLFVAPIVFLLWFTLPDVRRKEKRKWYMGTFIGSILWIAAFSYLMVWMASETSFTIGILPEVMGLTILAAGTSIPDLITSVIVAKKGYGDMAVSSSVGSNIFDITVGLPLPWMLSNAIFQTTFTDVVSKGLLCSITLLFFMLLAVIVTIALSKWKMSRLLGGIMFFFYVCFLTLSVLLELGYIPCPDVRYV